MQNLQKRPESQFEITKGIYTSGMLKTLKISPCSKLVLIAISQHYPNIFPSIKFLAENLGISESSVKNAIKELRNVGLIIYELNRVNHYRFTQKFFELVNITYEPVKNYLPDGQNLPTNKQKQKNNNNKGFKNFPKHENAGQVGTNLDKVWTSKNKTVPFQSYQQKGVDYKPYVPEERIKESPLDLSLEGAEDFLRNLPARMQNSFFARALRAKWNL